MAGSQSDGQILWISTASKPVTSASLPKNCALLRGTNTIRALLTEKTPAILTSAENAPGALEVVLRRADANARGTGRVRAYDLKGLSIGDAPFAFGSGNETKAKFELPIELRNEIARIEIDEEKTAGAVTLLDSRWKRRRVSVVSGATADTAQPLLAPTYYLTRALRHLPKFANPSPAIAIPCSRRSKTVRP